MLYTNQSKDKKDEFVKILRILVIDWDDSLTEPEP